MARITLEFPDKVDQMLEQLAQRDQISKPEVIRRALALYSYVHEVEKKHKLSIMDDQDKVLEEIVFD